MNALKYFFIFFFSIISSYLIIRKLKKGKDSSYLPFLVWCTISLLLIITDITKTSIGIIFSSFLILFMEGRNTLWNKKFDKVFLKNTLLWIGIITILYFTNIRINFLTKPDGSYIYFGKLSSILITTLWLLIIVNSIKLTSSIPGFTSSFVFTISLTFFVIAAAQRQNLNTALILSLALSAISLPFINYEFKYPNSHIAKNLNLLYGFLLGIISVTGMLKSPATISIVIPAVLLSIPILDTSYAIVSTLVIGKPKNLILESIIKKFADKDRSSQKIPLIIYFTGGYLALSSLILYFYPNIWIAMILLGNGMFLYTKVLSKREVAERNKVSEKFYIKDIPIDRVTLSDATRKIETFILSGKTHIVITPDSIALLTAQKDKEYKEILKKADLVTPDGIGLLFASKILGFPLIERVTGIDLVNKLLEIGEKKGYRFYFLGAKEGIAQKAKENICKKYPKIHITGVHHGYIDSIEKEVLKDIKEKKPDILLVGMGVPKQEKWIYRHLNELQVPVSIGVGGSFDVLSGKIPRAPYWMQKYGIEWVYRALKEPKRTKRIIKLPYFILWILRIAFIERVFTKKVKKGEKL